METHPLRSLMAAGILAAPILLISVPAQQATHDEAGIIAEIEARYRSFEGSAENQTWEMWRHYFLESPNIGNMHGTNLAIGYEEYEAGSLAYFRRPPEQRAAVRFEDLEVFVIDARTAWVKGVFVNTFGEREVRPLFYDSLVKTAEGWQVFFSYVAPPDS